MLCGGYETFMFGGYVSVGEKIILVFIGQNQNTPPPQAINNY